MSSKKHKPPANHPATKPNVFLATEFKGPLPPPDALEYYNTIQPGFAERIVAMAEQEMVHRHKQEDRVVTAEIEFNAGITTERKTGQFLAFAVAIAMVGTGAYLVMSGHEWAGGTIATSVVAGVVTAFLSKRER